MGDRTEVYLFIKVMAYHAAIVVRTKLKPHAIRDNWPQYGIS